MTLGAFLDRQAARFTERPAVVSGTTRWSYAELAQEVWALQWALMELGLGPGERVAIWLSSLPEWIVYLFATTRLGAIPVPINTRFGSHELGYIVAHSESAVLVSMGCYLDRDYGAILTEATGALPGSTGRAGKLPTLRRVIGIRGLKGPGVIDGAELRVRGFQQLARAGSPPPAVGDPEDVAILFYTSGTTAFPKGVPLTHRNLLPHSIGCGTLLGLRPEDRVLSLYPFFGISGGTNKILSTLAGGAALVFPDAFRPEEAYDLLENEECTVMHAVDVQVREMIRIARARGRGTAPARRGTIGFMTGPDAALAHEMGEALGLRRFVHGYGMTELNPMVLRNALDDSFDVCLRPGGRIAPGVEVIVVDPETRQRLAADEPGELMVRGETVMRGYYRDPEATAEAFDADGWFRTGDLGVRMGDGFIFYLGRLKDTIKTGGFNVSPQEIESFFRTHPAVEDVGATSAPDPRLGEIVVAFVKRRSGSNIDAADLHEFSRGRIANFKTPRWIRFVEELPYRVGPHGSKLRREVLREWAKSGEDACNSM